MQIMEIPDVVEVQKHYNQPVIKDVKQELVNILDTYKLSDRIKPGDQIAITVGSRGIQNIVAMVQQVVEEVKKCGGIPFIIPAMGSHGGGTAEGQVEILESLGITEENIHAEIRATMSVVEVGTTEHGTPTYVDEYAFKADGIIVMNRIKKHTDHNNITESGLMKMMTIGLGKQKQAELVHSYGVWGLKNLIPANAKIVIEKQNIIVGIAIIENALDETAYLEAVRPEDILKREPDLYKIAEEYFPWLPFKTCDVLVIKEVGKNISGTGMDTNTIGRNGVWGDADVAKLYAAGQNELPSALIEHIVALDITEESHGNATGIGQADIISKRLYDKIDLQATYNNVITASFLDKGKIPLTVEDDKRAIQVALKTLNGLIRLEGKKTIDNVKMCIIKSTLHHGKMWVSRGLLTELKKNEEIEVIGEFKPLEFDKDGNLLEL